MPESRIRRKGGTGRTPRGARAAVTDDGSPPVRSGPRPTPRWWVPVMLGLMLLGLVWIVVFYLSTSQYPVPQIGGWNLAAGFGLIIIGFAMTTRWR